ncbi:MAG: ribonuclease III [Clostridiaceae bacterium]|jgi:ribonuclease III|nr:ribonuclease III [Clostridiaceae bacterium]
MDELEKIFNIKIDNIENFKRALTHPSYTQENNIEYIECYERLEFLGDAVLKLTVSDILFQKYPLATEGDMSKIRSIVVSDAMLFEIAKKIGLQNLIMLGKHEEKQGLRKLESVVACSFEAILGAYYLDGKFEEIKEFIIKNFTEYIEDVDKNSAKYNAKAILQEYTQGLTKETPTYVLKDTTGPEHNKTFVVEVLYQDKVVSSGEGKTKKEAEQHAAYQACKKLGAIK